MGGMVGIFRRRAVGVITAVFLLASLGYAERTKLKPGWNLFSTQQDIEMGKQVSQDAERQLAMLNDRKVDDYLNRLGLKLAGKAPGAKYPYQFKGVNDSSINAFALPGGYLYVNRGTIEAADNEAQLAGVMGHEIGHVALRHGTNQASKAYAAQAPLAILGGLVGSNSITGVLAQIGAGFALNGVLLKYSRDAERQADLIGTQILSDSGYDPRAMAQFFEKLEAEQHSRSLDFFSSHPNPQNRIQNINKEIANLGGQPARTTDDSAEFRAVRQYLKSMPPAPKAAAPGSAGSPGTSGKSTPPPRPSGRFQSYQDNSLQMQYPDNWRSYGKEQALTLAPDGGIIDTGQGGALAYGMIMGLFEPQSGSRGDWTLDAANNQLVNSLQGSNPHMQVAGRSERKRVGGSNALATLLSNDSPLGGQESDWLVAVQRPEGLVYFVFVAPEKDFRDYQRTFEDMLNSVRFTGK